MGLLYIASDLSSKLCVLVYRSWFCWKGEQINFIAVDLKKKF